MYSNKSAAQTSCFHLDVGPSPGDRLKQEAHMPHMSQVQRPDEQNKTLSHQHVFQNGDLS